MIKTHVRFDQPALEATLLDYLHEVEHVAMRIVNLKKAIDEAVQRRQWKSEPNQSFAGIARSGSDDRRDDRLGTG